MKKRLPIRQRDTATLWRDLKGAAYLPLYTVMFLMVCFAGPDWSDYHWIGKILAVAFAVLVALGASRSISALVDELKERSDKDSNKTNP